MTNNPPKKGLIVDIRQELTCLNFKSVMVRIPSEFPVMETC